MAVKIREFELYNSDDGICKELDVNSGSSITLTCYGAGSAEFMCSTDSGVTYFPRFMVRMSDANVSSILDEEGTYYTICGDCDKIKIDSVTGFDKIIATIG